MLQARGRFAVQETAETLGFGCGDGKLLALDVLGDLPRIRDEWILGRRSHPGSTRLFCGNWTEAFANCMNVLPAHGVRIFAPHEGGVIAGSTRLVNGYRDRLLAF